MVRLPTFVQIIGCRLAVWRWLHRNATSQNYHSVGGVPSASHPYNLREIDESALHLDGGLGGTLISGMKNGRNLYWVTDVRFVGAFIRVVLLKLCSLF
jgi:hypothetical protein